MVSTGVDVVVLDATASTSGSVDGVSADSAPLEHAETIKQQHESIVMGVFTVNLSATKVWGQAAIVDPRGHANCGCSSMVERNLPKVDTRVRFPSSARCQVSPRSEAGFEDHQIQRPLAFAGRDNRVKQTDPAVRATTRVMAESTRPMGWPVGY